MSDVVCSTRTVQFVRCVAVITGVLLLSACGSSTGTMAKGDENDPWIVTITFGLDDNGDDCRIQRVRPEPNSCGLPDEDICVKRGKFIEWRSEPEGIDFDIFFGPLKKGEIKGNNGTAKSKVNDFAPPGFYKYGILGRDCPISEYLDPRIRVDN